MIAVVKGLRHWPGNALLGKTVHRGGESAVMNGWVLSGTKTGSTGVVSERHNTARLGA